MPPRDSKARPVRIVHGPDAGIPVPERLAAVRRRLREGAYDSPQVAEEIARRMLRSGDI